MATAEMKRHVEEILAKEDALDAFRVKAAGMTTPDGGKPSDEDIDRLCAFARGYVEAVITMIEESQEAAQKEQARAFAAPLMKLAGQYFLDPEDLIPDEMGLYGLVDDAYLAHLFIIRLSETVEKEKGFPLLDDLKAEHAPVIRAVLGNDIAERLEAKVAINLKSVIVRNHMAQAAMVTGTLPNGAMEVWRKVEEERARLSWTK